MARPTPSTSPNGTVINASLTVTHSACMNSADWNVSMYWSHPFDTHWRPCTLQRCWPSTIARPSGYSTNVTRTTNDGASSASATGSCLHFRRRLAGVALARVALARVALARVARVAIGHTLRLAPTAASVHAVNDSPAQTVDAVSDSPTTASNATPGSIPDGARAGAVRAVRPDRSGTDRGRPGRGRSRPGTARRRNLLERRGDRSSDSRRSPDCRPGRPARRLIRPKIHTVPS